jgi:uncharacterized metal-binding protein
MFSSQQQMLNATPGSNGTHGGAAKDGAIAAEKLVLGTVLHDGSHALVQVCSVFGTLDFATYAHQLIFRAAVALADRGDPIDAHTVAVELRARGQLDDVLPAYLVELATDNVTANLSFHIAALRDQVIRREVGRRGRRIIELAGMPDLRAEQLLQAAQVELDGLTQVVSGQKIKPIPASELVDANANEVFIVDRLIECNAATLLSAYWKAGKTTWLTHLLLALEHGLSFCGLRTVPTKVLYVTEEAARRWCKRRDKLGLADHVHFLCKPFGAGRPSFAEWRDFIRELGAVAKAGGFGLVILDTLSNLWCVVKENDAGEVSEALAPLNAILDTAAILAAHHLRKADGDEATGSRGSGAITAWVDEIIEMRRVNPKNRDDRQRILTCVGRADDLVSELVIELDSASGAYVGKGDRQHATSSDIKETVALILPHERPGLDFDGIKAAWPNDRFPRKCAVLDALTDGFGSGAWMRDGTGKRGNPYKYWVNDNSVSVPDYPGNQKTESP